MKKTAITLFSFFILASAAIAQESFELYKFANASEAEKVLKVISQEIKLSETEFAQVRNLLTVSGKSQEELFTKEAAKDVNIAKSIIQRQTMHIESNLRKILGEDKYKLYQSQKASISAKVQGLKN